MPSPTHIQNISNNTDTPKDSEAEPLDGAKQFNQESETMNSITHPNGAESKEKPDWTENRSSPSQQSDSQYSANSLPKMLDNEESEAPNPLPPVGSVINSVGIAEEDSQMSTEGGAGGFGESIMVHVKWPKVIKYVC